MFLIMLIKSNFYDPSLALANNIRSIFGQLDIFRKFVEKNRLYICNKVWILSLSMRPWHLSCVGTTRMRMLLMFLLFLLFWLFVCCCCAAVRNCMVVHFVLVYCWMVDYRLEIRRDRWLHGVQKMCCCCRCAQSRHVHGCCGTARLFKAQRSNYR